MPIHPKRLRQEGRHCDRTGLVNVLGGEDTETCPFPTPGDGGRPVTFLHTWCHILPAHTTHRLPSIEPCVHSFPHTAHHLHHHAPHCTCDDSHLHTWVGEADMPHLCLPCQTHSHTSAVPTPTCHPPHPRPCTLHTQPLDRQMHTCTPVSGWMVVHSHTPLPYLLCCLLDYLPRAQYLPRHYCVTLFPLCLVLCCFSSTAWRHSTGSGGISPADVIPWTLPPSPH